MPETDELSCAYPISHRFARGIIGVAFLREDGRHEFHGYSDHAQNLKDMVRDYLTKFMGREIEWSTVFYFIECIWSSVLLEFAAMISRSNPMTVSGSKPGRRCELRCQIIGDTLIIDRVSIADG